MNVNLDKALTDLYNRYGTRADRKVFTYLAEHAGSKGIVNITQSVIAQGSGVSKSTVPDSVNRLEDKGFLTVEKSVTDGGGTGTNIYHINPKYLIKTKPAHCKTKPQCAACYQGLGGPHMVPDYLSGWKLVTNDGEHESVSYASNTTDVQGLARLGIVMADVVKEIFKLYEEKSNK